MVRVGKLLEEERLKNHLTLEDVAKATKIRISYLTAIEQGDYRKLPSSAYITGFIKNYVDFLGLPQKEYLALFRREFNETEHLRVLPKGLTPDEELVPFSIRFSFPALGAIGFFLFLFVYLFFQYRYAIISPPLSLSVPKEGETVPAQLTLVGQTDPDASLTINEQPIAVESNGTFRKKLSLFPGKTTIRVKAQNRIGKTTEIERHVEVKEK